MRNVSMIYHKTEHGTIYCGDSLDVLKGMADESVDCCITSPPYWGLRDYGCDRQLGLEKTPEEYVFNMVQLFREVKRVLKDDGVLWLNLGDSYAGSGVHKEHHANQGISQSAKRGCTKSVFKGKLPVCRRECKETTFSIDFSIELVYNFF